MKKETQDLSEQIDDRELNDGESYDQINELDKSGEQQHHHDLLDDDTAAVTAAAVAAVNAATNPKLEYSGNIDEQLLSKNDSNDTDATTHAAINEMLKRDNSRQNNNRLIQQSLPNIQLHHHQQQLQQQQLHQHQQQQQLHQHQNHLLHKYEMYDDDSEYNIQIPEPIIDSKSKIYPVTENTITAEGNLITRPYPEQVFHSRVDLNDFILEFARDNAFGVVIAHSNRKAIYYTCELGGKYRHKKGKKDEKDQSPAGYDDDEESGNRYFVESGTKTKKLKCPFAMTASHKKATDVWTLKTTCNEHNHPQLDPLLNHPMLRKRLDQLNLLILDLYKVGTKPSHIESKIKDQFPDILIKREDIYNEIRGYKRKMKKQCARFNLPYVRGTKFPKPTTVRAAPRASSNEDDAVAAAFLSNGDHDLQYDHNLEEFRQFNAESGGHLQQHLEDQYHPFQLQDSMQSDSRTAEVIAAVANATRQHKHEESEDLSMENIDSRLVGE